MRVEQFVPMTSKTEGEAARKSSPMLREPRAAISWRRGLLISRVQALLAVFNCGWKSGDGDENKGEPIEDG